MSCLDLLPPFQEQSDFRLPTDQRCESSGLSHVKATGDTTLTQDLVYGDRLSNTSECLFAQVLAGKIALDQTIGRTTDHKRIGCSQPLHSRRDVGGFSEGKLLLSPSTAHFTDHHQPGMDAHAESELDTVSLLQILIQVSHGSEDTQPSPDGSLSIIFMCLRIAKVHQETIPQQLSNMS